MINKLNINSSNININNEIASQLSLNDHNIADIYSNNNISNEIKDELKCPQDFPSNIFKPERTLTCNELRFTMHEFGGCNQNDCKKCVPPNSKSTFANKIVGEFLNNYENSKIERKNSIEIILKERNNIFNKKYPLILMILNKGYLVFFYNYYCSLLNNNINVKNVVSNTLIIAMDNETRKHVELMGYNNIYEPQYLLSNIDDISKLATDIEWKPHKYSVAIQIAILKDLIDMNYNVLLQDGDLIWISNPIPYLISYQFKLFDILQIHDHRWDKRGPGNSGFIMIKSNCKTKFLLLNILKYVSIPLYLGTDQQLWNMMLTSIPFRDIHIHFLNHNYFINGNFVNLAKNTNRSSLSNKMILFHCSWTGDHFDKINKFINVNLWYYNKQKCSKYFNDDILLDLKHRQGRSNVDERLVPRDNQHKLLLKYGAVKDTRVQSVPDEDIY